MKNTPKLTSMMQVEALLRARGFSPSAIAQIRVIMVDDAVRNAEDVKSDRIYALIALTLHRVFGFGVKRIMKYMHQFDHDIGEIAEGKREWNAVMSDLEAETGIVVHSGDADRFAFEYQMKGDPDA